MSPHTRLNIQNMVLVTTRDGATDDLGASPGVDECGAERLEDIEGGEDEDGEEEGVVVEDGEGGRLVLGHLVLLPEDALVLLLAADLLVVVELLRLTSDYFVCCISEVRLD